jgi:hypothetical protein
MPSLEVAKHANRAKSGKAIGRYRIVFTNTNVKGEVRPRPKWEVYRDKFELPDSATNPKFKRRATLAIPNPIHQVTPYDKNTVY